MRAEKPHIIKSDGTLSEAVSALKRGSIVAYPTETLYGLGVDPMNEAALASLFELKGRAPDTPVSVIIGSIEMLFTVAAEVPELGQRMIERFWPGPLTIVFKARPDLSGMLTAGTGTVGVRVPGLKVARALSDAFGGPVTATSANPSGERGALSAEEVIDYFGTSLDVVIDGGELKEGPGSTVVDVTGPDLRVLREGAIASKLLNVED